jgi:hypothetical protein
LQGQIETQKNKKAITLDPYPLGDGKKYVVESTVISNDHQFWKKTTQDIFPRKCMSFIDVDSKQGLTKRTIYRGGPKAAAQTN